jgi:hypothetical protein
MAVLAVIFRGSKYMILTVRSNVINLNTIKINNDKITFSDIDSAEGI